MKTMKRSIFVMGVTAVAAGLPRRLRAQSAPGLTSIRIGTAFNDDATPVVYAQKAGIFAKYGLEVEIIKALGPAAAAMIGGSFEFGKSTSPAAFQAYEHGIGLGLVAAAAVETFGVPYTAFLMKNESPAQTGKDFEGKVVGLAQLKSVGEISIRKFVDGNGGDSTKIQFVEVPIPAAAGAVDTGRVYASECAYPSIQVGLDTGRMKIADLYRELGRGTVITAWAVTNEYSKNHPDVVRAFARAWRESTAYTNAHHSATVEMMAAFTAIPAEVISKMPRATPTGTLVPSQLQQLIDDCAHYGALSKSFPAASIIDPNIK
jgi:NitT/TauT family transport system substrate-binding protein